MPIIAGRASAAYGAGFAAVTTPPYLGPFGSFDALSTVTVTSGVSSITFSGIPAGYRHLQIRTFCRDNTASQSAAGFIILNGDTGSNYAGHQFYSDGASVSASASATTTPLATIPTFTMAGANAGANVFGSNITDIFDYYSSTKYKTIRTVNGLDVNGSGGYVLFRSGLWTSTAPVTSITLQGNGTTIQQYSSFALYGVK